MSQTHWRVLPTDLTEHETDYTADFVCLNVDAGRTVKVTLHQNKREPASDLIGALTAVAQTLQRAACGEEPETTQVARLH